MSGFPVTNGVTTFSAPPEGYVVDFDNPQQQKVLEHYLLFGIGGSLAFIALLQRFYTKIYLSKGLHIDDGFMLLGWTDFGKIASVITQAMLVQSIVEKGFCTHSWEMPLERFARYSVTTYVTAPVFMLCNGFTKLSLLTFYLQLSPQLYFRVAVWISIGIVATYTAVITLLMIFHCNPVKKAFDFTVTEGTCMDAGILYIATAVSNIITDVILFALPIRTVLGLRMGLEQKLGAIFIFAIGSVTIATSIVRLALLPPVLRSTDPSWDAAPANLWTFVEANIFIICGSIPTLRKFFKHFAPRLMGSSNATSKPSYIAEQYASRHTRTRKQGNHYEPFPDDTEMMAYSPQRDATGNKATGTSTVVDINPRRAADNTSQEAILQTKSYTVQYE
ncbi:uncharacterized protein JN550_008365 [Neoarthrinium moseri]|uniref:uncharacterized protein n=1 Tax=Neoarthrinium moseri TaxID=1658444 RepID=UPI001FDDB582|nr:uncharacterized protein JN550_008365 [Neoarthrinium moseri]KAI1865317.1 hypothetical protein JN550_008365 [Neoarthrinium moseri]